MEKERTLSPVSLRSRYGRIADPSPPLPFALPGEVGEKHQSF
jgi:hypothetical protein